MATRARPKATKATDATRADERQPAFPDVRIETGAAFELVAELAAFTSGPARGSLESGKTWVREVRALAGGELIRRVERYGFGVHVELATIALEADAPRGVDELVRSIEAMDADAFRRRLLGADSAMTRSMVSDGAIDRAIGGDRPARTELETAFGVHRAGRQAIGRLLDSDARALQREIRSIVADWGARVSSRFADGSLAAIARDAAARQGQLAGGASGGSTGRDVLASATRGVSYEPPPWIVSIAIVPTVAMRPFIVPVELRETVVFVCSVADEAFDADPSAPPQRLVKVAAALGDERRLRILRLLRDEPLTASEIADRMGVDRTSLHHHLGILRSAGLLAIRDEGLAGWRYALREDGLEHVGSELVAYLRSSSADAADEGGGV
jgi:DNA-binding transcriptional ArsR family regulator